MNYVSLQVKSSYSLLDSINNIENLVSLAKTYGYTSLAITDHDNMFGVVEFYNTCKKYQIKPIIGIELTINDGIVLLYAKNNSGYKNLIKLSTVKSDTDISIDDLIKYKDNLILIMPIYCYNDEIYNIYEDKYIGYTDISSVKDDNRVYINDVRYLYKDDYKYLDYAKMIKLGKVLGEYSLLQDSGSHLLTMEELLKIDNISLNNMDKISSICNVEIGYIEGLLPVYDENINNYQYLKDLAYKGLNKRFNNNVEKKYIDRLEYELSIINKMGFCDYFLIVYDYVLYAKKNNILVGPGRGSAAGSLVSYTLGITDIDPIKYNLLFERFLNPERVTMPDIDIDFDANKRMDVIDYVTKKYGEKKVCGIITFNTLGAKQVVRDLGRVLKLNQRLIDSIAKMCTKDLKTSYQENANLKRIVDGSYEVKKLFEIGTHLEGLPRHVSIHAAGVVMSRIDIDESIPLYKNQLGMYVTGYSKDYLEPIGLLKMDFLGISNLTMIDEVISMIRNNTKLNITFQNIPLDDKKTYELFSKGDTDGVFQFESSGIKQFLKKLKPTNFLDIVSCLSLYRPGPMDSIDDYIKRRNGSVIVDYIDDSLKDILEETYGIIIYQEQIMQIACIVAGYSLGQADVLRRAMSKKKEDILLKEREKFIKSSLNRGYKEEVVNKIYDRILKFANYGFNKSHAVSYAMISYKMAFIKTHFYPYFMVSLLNSSINNPDKTSTYIALLKSRGVRILLPDINKSSNNYLVINNEVLCPISIINNVGSVISNLILKEREKGEFIDFIDFCIRMYNQSINKKVIISLIDANTFSCFGYNKKTLVENIDIVLNYAFLVSKNSLIKIEKPLIEEYPEYSHEELIDIEFKTFGFYLTSHPVSRYKNNSMTSTLCLEELNNTFIELILEVINIKEIVTKNNDVMAFIKARDEFKEIDLTIFPKLYKDNRNISKYDIIKIVGRVEKRFNNYQIIVSKINKLSGE